MSELGRSLYILHVHPYSMYPRFLVIQVFCLVRYRALSLNASSQVQKKVAPHWPAEGLLISTVNKLSLNSEGRLLANKYYIGLWSFSCHLGAGSKLAVETTSENVLWDIDDFVESP